MKFACGQWIGGGDTVPPSPPQKAIAFMTFCSIGFHSFSPGFTDLILWKLSWDRVPSPISSFSTSFSRFLRLEYSLFPIFFSILLWAFTLVMKNYHYLGLFQRSQPVIQFEYRFSHPPS